MEAMIKDFTAGSAGGTACVLFGQPLDTIKVKMQAFPQLYRHAYDCFRQILTQETFRGLYAGTVPSLFANISENAVLFLAYGQCRKVVQYVCGVESEGQMTTVQRACSGSLASIFSSMVLCPTELIKCRLQALHQLRMTSSDPSKIPKIGPFAMVRKILKTEGITGMYRGFTSTLVREMPGYFFFFGGYEVSKKFLSPEGSLLVTPICGGFAGVCLWVAVFPIDAVKSRIQVLSAKGISTTDLTFIKTAKSIFRNEGFYVFYKGLGPTLLRSFPANGALFFAYEGTLRLLNYS